MPPATAAGGAGGVPQGGGAAEGGVLLALAAAPLPSPWGQSRTGGVLGVLLIGGSFIRLRGRVGDVCPGVARRDARKICLESRESLGPR